MKYVPDSYEGEAKLSGDSGRRRAGNRQKDDVMGKESRFPARFELSDHKVAAFHDDGLGCLCRLMRPEAERAIVMFMAVGMSVQQLRRSDNEQKHDAANREQGNSPPPCAAISVNFAHDCAL